MLALFVFSVMNILMLFIRINLAYGVRDHPDFEGIRSINGGDLN